MEFGNRSPSHQAASVHCVTIRDSWSCPDITQPWPGVQETLQLQIWVLCLRRLGHPFTIPTQHDSAWLCAEVTFFCVLLKRWFLEEEERDEALLWSWALVLTGLTGPTALPTLSLPLQPGRTGTGLHGIPSSAGWGPGKLSISRTFPPDH